MDLLSYHMQNGVDAVAVRALQVDDISVQDHAVFGVPGGVLLYEGFRRRNLLVLSTTSNLSNEA